MTLQKHPSASVAMAKQGYNFLSSTGMSYIQTFEDRHYYFQCCRTGTISCLCVTCSLECCQGNTDQKHMWCLKSILSLITNSLVPPAFQLSSCKKKRQCQKLINKAVASSLRFLNGAQRETAAALLCHNWHFIPVSFAPPGWKWRKLSQCAVC